MTAGELRDFKATIIGSYKLGLATSEGAAGQLLVNAQRGLPVAYIDGITRRIAALTLDEVNGAIKRHLDPATMLTVEAGSVPAPGGE